jgi:hypothetical protein
MFDRTMIKKIWRTREKHASIHRKKTYNTDEVKRKEGKE